MREACIGALAALVGAVVGAGAAYLGTHAQITATAEAARDQRQAAAIGTARLMRREFDTWADSMRDRLDSGLYAERKIRTTTELDSQTRLQVASAVKSGVWIKIADAAKYSAPAAGLANRQPRKEMLSKKDVVRAMRFERAFMAASAALKPLATKNPPFDPG